MVPLSKLYLMAFDNKFLNTVLTELISALTNRFSGILFSISRFLLSAFDINNLIFSLTISLIRIFSMFRLSLPVCDLDQSMRLFKRSYPLFDTEYKFLWNIWIFSIS